MNNIIILHNLDVVQVTIPALLIGIIIGAWIAYELERAKD